MYHVVRNTDLKALEAEVEEYMAMGYKLAGTLLFTAQLGVADDYGRRPGTFFQPMCKDAN